MKAILRSMSVLFVALGVLLSACSPGGTPAATPTPVPTPAAAATSVPTPTAIPTPTLTTVPTVEVLEDVVVERIEVRVLESFPVQVQVAAYGKLPDACSLIDGVEQAREGNAFEVTLEIARRADARCAPNPTPFEHTVPLEVVGLKAGSYAINVHGASGSFLLAADNVLEAGAIGGQVWHDVCGLAGGEGGLPAVPSAGCVTVGCGYQADGVFEADEPGIEGVLVTLGAGECPSTGLATAVTGADGTYVFDDLEAGTYCVMVDAKQEANATILLPGNWTGPVLGRGRTTVTLDPGMRRMDVHFGWDHQFLPADESAPFAAWLKERLAARDYEQVRALMADPFAIAGWRSEGQSYSPEQAVEQLQNNQLGADTHVTYPGRDVMTLLEGANPFQVFGPEVRVVRVLFASGWGPEGKDEALLYITQEPDGAYRWHGVLAAFGGFGSTATPLVSSGCAVADYASLVENLQGAAATVETAGELSQDFFSVKSKVIQVNGVDVQVYEYESEAAAQEEATLVSPTGSPIGTTMVTWVETPHFYTAGRLIVLYVGDDDAVKRVLESVLGPQFAGG